MKPKVNESKKQHESKIVKMDKYGKSKINPNQQ